MSDRNHEQALAYILGVVSRARTVRSGVEALFAFGERVQPRDPIWPALRAIDFAADAEQVERDLAAMLETKKIGARHRGVYFDYNMGGDIAVRCTESWPPAEDEDETQWTHACSRHVGDLESEALARVYREVALGHLAEGLLAFGYVGLALRRAAARIEPATLIGRAGSRGFGWGFSCSAPSMLGTADAKGFTAVHHPAAALPARAWRAEKPKPRATVPTVDLSRPPGPGPRRELAAYRATLDWLKKPIAYSPAEVMNGHAVIAHFTEVADRLYELGDRKTLRVVQDRIQELIDRMAEARPPRLVFVLVEARAAIVWGQAADPEGARMFLANAHQHAAMLRARWERDAVASTLAEASAAIATMPD